MSAAARRIFRPHLLPSIAALVALLILVGLGTWQMDRLAWKNDLIARIDAGLAADPVDLPAAIDHPADWEYRRVRVTGRFLHERETYIGPRLYAGPDGRQQQGVHVLTPLVRDDGAGMVLIDRGWVPLDRRDPAGRAEGQLDGSVTITAIARVPQDRAFMQPDNDPATRTFFWLDMPALAAIAGVDRLGPLVLQVDATPNPGGLPIGGRTIVALKNDHLSYALTWYGLALTLVGVFIAASFRRQETP
ncbi:SURF1 family protein [Niveispirillum sp. KHB5.9]|uniref:SURF1 family protein n=1 Tax=Niveispirillum sp. KHB5.9 TaxID=3400269 RepID=UPI003A89BADB